MMVNAKLTIEVSDYANLTDVCEYMVKLHKKLGIGIVTDYNEVCLYAHGQTAEALAQEFKVKKLEIKTNYYNGRGCF